MTSLERVENRIKKEFVDDLTMDPETVRTILQIISEEKHCNTVSIEADVKIQEHLDGLILAVRNDTLFNVMVKAEELLENKSQDGLTELIMWIKEGGKKDGICGENKTD